VSSFLFHEAQDFEDIIGLYFNLRADDAIQHGSFLLLRKAAGFEGNIGPWFTHGCIESSLSGSDAALLAPEAGREASLPFHILPPHHETQLPLLPVFNRNVFYVKILQLA